MDATYTPEEWRPVVGREGEYEVSDLGRVRSLDRTVDYIHGKTGTKCTRRARSRVLRPGASTSGHLHVVLGGRATRTVHSLVAEAFLGPRPDGYEIRHINGSPADCRVTNLEYGTRSQNSEDSKLHGTHFYASLTHCKRGHELSGDNLQKTPGSKKRVCLACRRERQAVYNTGSQLTKKGHCMNGHPMTPENRYTNGEGRTRCKPCALGRNKKAG